MYQYEFGGEARAYHVGGFPSSPGLQSGSVQLGATWTF